MNQNLERFIKNYTRTVEHLFVFAYTEYIHTGDNDRIVDLVNYARHCRIHAHNGVLELQQQHTAHYDDDIIATSLFSADENEMAVYVHFFMKPERYN